MDGKLRAKLATRIQELDRKSMGLLFEMTPTMSESNSYAANTYGSELAGFDLEKDKAEQAEIDRKREAVDEDIKLLKRVLDGELDFCESSLPMLASEWQVIENEINELKTKQDLIRTKEKAQKRIKELLEITA